jgi:hypothetical protein
MIVPALLAFVAGSTKVIYLTTLRWVSTLPLHLCLDLQILFTNFLMCLRKRTLAHGMGLST